MATMSFEEIDAGDLTPMMEHWYSIKKKYKDHLIAYRMGDFFEFFYDDAIRVSKLLGITLTKRKISDDEYPLAGIPHHSGNYLKNLVKKGETVVIVEQLEDPSNVKGRIVKRGVVRILSPGTITEADMLKSNENNYIASLVKEKKGYGCSFADISTGEFVAVEYFQSEKDPKEKLLSVFARFSPVELIVPEELKKEEKLFLFLTDVTEALIKTYEDYYFEYDEAYNLIKRHFNISNLKGFGLEKKEMAVQAAGGLLAFLKETQRDVIPNIFKINVLKEDGILHLDYTTQRNLELITSLWEKGKDATLYSVFNHTETPMGARLLKKIIVQPLANLEEINHRLNIVQKLKDDIFLRSDLRDELGVIGDLERYINRITYKNRTNARDLLNIKNSLEIIPKILDLLKQADIPEISKYLESINDFRETRSLINNSVKEDPPTKVKEGGIIKDGYNSELDKLRDILQNGKQYLLEYESAQKDRLTINAGLKIGHNNILGYYIQITKNTLKSIKEIPNEYVERQTLKNSKRFTTKKLKDLEQEILTAEDKINDLEYDLFCNIREQVEKETLTILETAKNIAHIDVYSCFAEIAEKYNYCKPNINESNKIHIEEGRHPVVEQMHITERFIPNDCKMDTESEQILIITGPNMSGKSTYLRQVALICLIAQMGCFVPAKSAKLGIVDQIFTRIGASDDLARKLSTFMIEMTETAKILNYATEKSLVIIDELGRGTSTSDGQSIAIATLEKLHKMKIKTLFSTHYHQLTEIDLPRVKNYHLDIIENDDGSINFVRTLRPGGSDKSYGIHVARLAGIPDDVIIKAFQILEEIEENDPFKDVVETNNHNKSADPGKYYDKIISGKKKQLESVTKSLKSKKREIDKCIEDLDKKQEVLEKKETQINELETKIEELKRKKDVILPDNKSRTKEKKKMVQTTFFKPVVKKKEVTDERMEQIVEFIRKLDINSVTPVEAMKKLIKIKEMLENKS
ncbi:MAG: DNA mismatch repair protein MutS [Promethearchaeota archaeon]|nr:MAG: DNA mismatch repair protein MutS [Candidatus Lokiarchaeota archaeon]